MRRSDIIPLQGVFGGRSASQEERAALYLRYPVLYVDDEAPNLDVFEASFGDRFEVICVNSAAEALDVMAREPVAVMITDNRMPDMTGIDLCAEVSQRYAHVMRVLCTGYSDQHTVIEAINRGGVHSYLVKPWDADEVEDLISRLISQVHFEADARDLRKNLLVEERRAAVKVMRKRVRHELTDIVTLIQNASALIQTSLPQVRASISTDIAEELQVSVDELMGATDRLMLVYKESRVQTVGDVPELQEGRLYEAIESVSRLVWAELSGVATLDYSCDESLVFFADKVSIVRVLYNLLTHCVQTIAEVGLEPGQIRLHGQRCANGICVDVSHNAPVSSIVERRALANSAWSRIKKASDLDLSLPISRELAEANGGTLEVVDLEDSVWTPALRLTLPNGEDV